jgi:hypothetical protein
MTLVSRKAEWWDTATPYHNVRIEEKDDHDILVVGGEDHNSGMKFEDYHDAYSNLEKWAKARWTSAGDVLYKWTGQVIVKVYMSVYYKIDVALQGKRPKHLTLNP